MGGCGQRGKVGSKGDLHVPPGALTVPIRHLLFFFFLDKDLFYSAFPKAPHYGER